MDNSNSYLLNCAIDRFAYILAERISFYPPAEDDLERKESMMFANDLAQRYAEIIDQSKVTEIANSSGTLEEKLERITKEIEQKELAEVGILLEKDLCESKWSSCRCHKAEQTSVVENPETNITCSNEAI